MDWLLPPAFRGSCLMRGRHGLRPTAPIHRPAARSAASSTFRTCRSRPISAGPGRAPGGRECLSRSREDYWREMRPCPDRDHEARDPIVAQPILLDVSHLNGWAAQWDQLVDSSPLQSPFLRSWWLTGAGGPGSHFLLVVNGAHLLGGLALEKRHPI